MRRSPIALCACLAPLALAACSSGDGVTPEGAAALQELTLSAGSINPAFDPGVHAYSAVLPAGTLNVSVTATAAAGTSVTLSQDGGAATALTSGAASPPLAVPARGARSMLSVVTTSGQSSATYTIQLVQADDNDATLSGLALSAGSLNPAFSSAVTRYSVTIPSGTTGFKVTPTATTSDIKSITVSQDGATPGTVGSGQQSSSLKVPAAGVTSTVVIAVTAQNGYDTLAYTLSVTLSGNNDATLQSLTASKGTLSPAFASGTTSYTLLVPVGTPAVTLTPTANNASARAIVLSQDGGTPATLASGAASASLPVPAIGSTSMVAIRVIAQDGNTSVTYTVTIRQDASNDAALSGLTISAGALSPAFSGSVFAYTDTVPFGTGTVTVSPTAHALAVHSITVSLNGGSAASVPSGTVSPALAVPAVGANSTISVVVTAQDLVTQRTYTIALSQVAPATDNELSSLEVSVGALSPGFTAETLEYTLSVPFGTTDFTVTPTASTSSIQSITVTLDAGQPVTVASGAASPSLAIPPFGSTSTVFVDVMAQSGAVREYKIVVSQAGRNDSTLSGLTDSAGALTGFDPGTATYAYSVPFQASAYTITATTNDPLATLKVNGVATTSGQPTTVTLAPGMNTIAIVVTSADATSNTTYTLTITEGAAPFSNIEVTQNSTGVTSGGPAVDFGSAVTIGSVSITFTIANSGTGPMAINSATVSSGATDFSITSAPASPVAAADSTTMVVRFAPSASGTRTGAITIVNSSANQPSFVVNLTGTGVNAVSSIQVAADGGSTTLDGAGTTLQLTATVSPADAAQMVTWSSGSPTIATVDANGLVTAVNFGTAVITATATDGSGKTGTLSVGVTGDSNYLAFVKQVNGTANAISSNGVITVTSTYGTSGNVFTYTAPNYYGTSAAAFIALPAPVSGDFSITATVTLTATPKASSACGVGVGMTTGFAPVDRYGYVAMNGKGSVRYVSGPTTVTNSTNPQITAITLNTPLQVTFSRTGSSFTYGWVGNTATNPASQFTDGTTVYGAGTVYPAIAFNNVTATITNVVMKDGSGTVLFDSSTGTVVATVPAGLTLSSPTATAVKGASTTVTATATAPGGGTAAVSAVSSDTTIATVSVTNGSSNSTITINGVKVGTVNVTVTNTSDPNPATNTKTIAVTVEEFNASDNYGSIDGKVHPAPGETEAYTDGELSITFDAPPTLTTGGSIDVYKLADGSLVDRIFYANETQTVAGVTMQVGAQLARVSGNTVYFTPHFGKLAYGTQYYVGISTTAVSAVLNNNTFVGFSNLNTVATWSFTTRSEPTLGATVNVDGSQATSTADFRTLGGALMYLAVKPVSGATAVTVNVAPGTYNELVNYRATANPNLTITIHGPDGNARGDNAVVQYANGGKLNAQNGRASFYFAGANLVVENLTFRNTGDRASYAQAETLYFDSRGTFTVAVNNSSFLSNQDTIQTSGRAWFYNSFIEGNTDFIWGTSDAALFENCDLHVVSDPGLNNPYSIFVARTGTTGAATIGKGYVLFNSRVSVDSGMVAAYGRDAGAGAFYDQVALVNDTFSGGGTLAAGLWDTRTAPLSLGDSTYVGWKASGNTGLGAETATTVPGTASSIASLSTEYDNRSHILNRVVTVSGGTPTGFADASFTWDVSALAAAWGAP